jgi:hypothetical protein
MHFSGDPGAAGQAADGDVGVLLGQLAQRFVAARTVPRHLRVCAAKASSEAGVKVMR